jgi:hypothetical protein
MKIYVMEINGKRNLYKSEYDRNYAYNLLKDWEKAVALTYEFILG